MAETDRAVSQDSAEGDAPLAELDAEILRVEERARADGRYQDAALQQRLRGLYLRRYGSGRGDRVLADDAGATPVPTPVPAPADRDRLDDPKAQASMPDSGSDGADATDATEDGAESGAWQPEDPAGYQFTRPDRSGPYYDHLESAFRHWSHDLGLTQGQAHQVYNAYDRLVEAGSADPETEIRGAMAEAGLDDKARGEIIARYKAHVETVNRLEALEHQARRDGRYRDDAVQQEIQSLMKRLYGSEPA